MRQILIDDARGKGRDKRDAARVQGSDALDGEIDARATAEMLDVDAALAQLERESPRLAQIATFRYFAGYTETEIGELLDVDERTVRRDWTKAKLWLHRALSGSAS
jgi:RNA polymerase sigma factor (TIGR02999 family)